MFVPALQSVGHLGIGGGKGSKKGERERKGKDKRGSKVRETVSPSTEPGLVSNSLLIEPNIQTFRSEVVPPSKLHTTCLLQAGIQAAASLCGLDLPP